ncbi:MAG: hypothetical protein ACOYOU_20275, partial [Kiritimatiellia bacterium]
MRAAFRAGSATYFWSSLFPPSIALSGIPGPAPHVPTHVAGCGPGCTQAAGTIAAPMAAADRDFQQSLWTGDGGATLTGPQVLARLDRLYDALQATDRDLPRDTFD